GSPAVGRDRVIRFCEGDFGRESRDGGWGFGGRSRRQTEISVVRVFPAELFRMDHAQVVEFFDESQRVVSLHPGREVVVYVIPSPGRIGFVHAPTLAAKSAEISPHAIGRALLASAATVHLPIDLLTPVPQAIRL